MNRNIKKRFNEAVMKRIVVIACCVMMLLFIACTTPVFIVHNNSTGANVDGIPFYIKKAKCLHQSVYVVPYYQITLQKMIDSKVDVASTITISSQMYQSKVMQNFLASILKSTETEFKNKLTSWNDFNEDPYAMITANDTNWPKYLVTNNSAFVTFVDYGNTYTLNAKTPLVGTANITYKLNDDGTLSDGSGQIQEQTLSTVLSAVTDTFKTAVSVSGRGAGTKATEQEQNITLQAVVEKRFLKETLSRYETFQVGCGTNGDVVAANYDTLIEEVTGDSTKDKKSSETADDNSVKFNGTVTLPKSLGTASTAKDASGSKSASDSTKKK